MQSNDYGAYDAYDYVGTTADAPEDDGLLVVPGQPRPMDINFDDPKIASMPRILLMGPRRGGKTSIQVSKKWFLLYYIQSMHPLCALQHVHIVISLFSLLFFHNIIQYFIK